MDERFELAVALDRRARQLIGDAAKLGFVITIGTKPRQPLAMGNYGMVISVREHRAVYNKDIK